MITRRTVLKGVAAVGASVAAFGAYAIGIEPMLRLSTVRYRLTPQGWPADMKLRIVAIADIHACDPWMSLDRVAALVRTANSLDGDLILLLGDYLAGRRLPAMDVDPVRLAGLLGGLKAPLGCYGILGNHDWWRDDAVMAAGSGTPYLKDVIEGAGIPVLDNDAVRLLHLGRPFWLAGLGDQIAFYWSRRRRGLKNVPDGVDDLPKVLARITDDAPAILMAHEPDIFPRLPDRFALTLSGHTHGGQVDLLGWRPVGASTLSRRYARGHFSEKGRDLVVSSGLGCSILPVRVGVPPEIMVVELGGDVSA